MLAAASTPGLSTLLRGFFYPILLRSQLGRGALKKTSLDAEPLVVYRNPVSHSVIVHSDVCPHQGASLAKGRLTSDGTLTCPYHGFAFHNGQFCGIPDPSVGKHKCRPRPNAPFLSLLETYEDADFVYAAIPALNVNNGPAPLPYQPPEATDPSFTRISGSRIIRRPQMMTSENILDNLHLAHVHMFGNRATPLPKAIRYEPIGLIGGRSHFVYTPRPGTLSTWLGGDTVRVENEFHLPTCTLTRVFAGDNVKTVLTRAQPLDPHSCVLYWTVYRNFHTHPLFDGLMRAMMEYTLDEDVSMLRDVYPTFSQQLTVGYDVTILEYRKAVRLFLEQQQETS